MTRTDTSLPLENDSVLTRHGIVSGRHDAVMLFAQICQEQESAQNRWVAGLRAMGIKAAHPDDGHVDRECVREGPKRKPCSVTFAYPQFNDGPQVGDMIVLGWYDKWRAVKVYNISEAGCLSKRVSYEFWP